MTPQLIALDWGTSNLLGEGGLCERYAQTFQQHFNIKVLQLCNLGLEAIV